MSSPPKPPRKGKGRKKVPMARIENEASRRVAFSKRHDGLFSKANELSTLTGAQVGIVAFSPSGKPYSFGQPSVNSILNWYTNPLNQNNNPPPVNQLAVGESSNARYTRVVNQNQEVKGRGKEHDQTTKTPEMKQLLDSAEDLDEQTYEQICLAAHKLEEALDAYWQNRIPQTGGNMANPNLSVGASSSNAPGQYEEGTSRRNINDEDISRGAGNGRGSS